MARKRRHYCINSSVVAAILVLFLLVTAFIVLPEPKTDVDYGERYEQLYEKYSKKYKKNTKLKGEIQFNFGKIYDHYNEWLEDNEEKILNKYNESL